MDNSFIKLEITENLRCGDVIEMMSKEIQL